jgi:flavin-dependent dehydrogenase
MPSQTTETCAEVTVIGGGLAGKAASLHLAKAGLKVICIEPEDSDRQAVGESLDWSAPELLKALGLPMDELVQTSAATWKRHVILKLPQGPPEDYVPVPWLARPPFRVELRTLHVDRARLDAELLKRTLDSGVSFIRDKVARVERNGRRIFSAVTSTGQRFSSPWFIDATGFATSLLAREFKLRTIYNGPPKAAIWTYFKAPDAMEGTTLYMQPVPTEYLDWIWEIPINPDVVSVGYVTTGASMKSQRERGLSVENIFQRQLQSFPRFEPMLRAGALSGLNVTSFRSRSHVGVVGPNWFITGEAASMVDPITANGVTAALRHAAEASALILKYRQRGTVPLPARFAYSFRILQMAQFFNNGIEQVVYQPPVRNRFGIRNSGTAYISPAWSMNLVYARLSPKGILSTSLFSLLLGFFRASEWIVYELCRLFSPAVRTVG